MKLGWAALIAAMLLPLPAKADEQYLTGESFLSACTIADPEWISFCHGYVQAVFDGFRRPGDDICAPASVTKAKIVGDVVALFTGSQEARELRAYSVVYAVLLRDYPC